MSMAEVDLEQLTKEYPGGILALRDVNLHVHAGEFLVLVGPSGCGKTTLLRLIAGLEQPTRGTVRFDARAMNAVAPRHREVGMVFQRPALYPHRTVRDNLAYGLRLRRRWREPIPWDRVDEVAQQLSLTDVLDRRPAQLSGGQQQRVALGRALVRRPRVLLLDEPLSNLDAPLRLEMRRVLHALHARLPTTILHVTHDPQEALSLGDRVAVLENGSLRQVDRPVELYRRPRDRFVAGFLGSPPMNFLEGRLVETPAGLAFAWAAHQAVLPPETARRWSCWKGRPVTVGIRPEHLNLVAEGDLPPARIVQVESWGFADVATVDGPGGRLTLLTRGCDSLRVGDTISLAIPWNLSHLFDGSDGGRMGEEG
jgi:multiple sugar transport system ATP-binding protein